MLQQRGSLLLQILATPNPRMADRYQARVGKIAAKFQPFAGGFLRRFLGFGMVVLQMSHRLGCATQTR